MRPDDLERLLWELSEGTITAEDRARLDAHLAADPVAERRRREVKAMADMLGAVGEVTPPPSLAPSIETAVSARTRPRPRRSWREVVAGVLAPQWRVRVAWALVGLVVGMTSTALMVADFGRTSEKDIARLYGSMGTLQTGGGAPVQVPLADGLGSLTLGAADGELTLELAVARPVSGGVTVEVVGEGLSVLGVRAGAGSAARVDGGASKVVATLDGAGNVSARIGLPAQGGALAVRVEAGGATVLERGLDVPGTASR